MNCALSELFVELPCPGIPRPLAYLVLKVLQQHSKLEFFIPAPSKGASRTLEA